MRKFQETVNIQPQTFSTQVGSIAPQLQSLSQRLDNFSSDLARQKGQEVMEKASIEGRQAGITAQKTGQEMPQKEETFIGGIRKKAFNKAAREGYIKSLDNDIIETFNGIASENPNNLQAYNDQSELAARNFLDNVDPASRSAVELSIDSMISRQRPKIQARQAQEIIDQNNQEQTINTDKRSRMAFSSAYEGDNEQAAINLAAAIDSINNRTDINSVKKTNLINDLNREAVESGLSGQLNRTYDELGPEGALSALDGMKAPKGFTPDEWRTFVQQEQTTITRRMARQKQELQKATEEAKIAAKTARGELFTNPTIPLDPTNKTDREDVNLYYGQASQEWTNLPVQDQINLNVEFVNNTGIIPNELQSSINSSMRSGTAEQVTLMTDVVSRIQEESPQALRDIPEQTRAVALQVSDAVRAGIDPETAIDMARQSTFGLTSQERETIRMVSAENAKGLNKTLQNFVDIDVSKGGFDQGIFFNVPDVPVEMLAEYRTSYDRFMQMTGGKVDQAQKLAYNAVKETWSTTTVGGERRFMKYAPEAIYQVQGFDDEWMENQFNEEIENLGYSRAIIGVDHSTARESRPSYIVMSEDKNGFMAPVFDEDGDILRWKPDITQTEEYKELMGMPAEKVRSAKEMRRANQERRANIIRRGVNSRIIGNPSPEKYATAINNMLVLGRIDEAEAAEARKAFGVE